MRFFKGTGCFEGPVAPSQLLDAGIASEPRCVRVSLATAEIHNFGLRWVHDSADGSAHPGPLKEPKQAANLDLIHSDIT